MRIKQPSASMGWQQVRGHFREFCAFKYSGKGQRAEPRREGIPGIYGAELVAGPPCCVISWCVRRHWHQNLSWQDEQQQNPPPGPRQPED